MSLASPTNFKDQVRALREKLSELEALYREGLCEKEFYALQDHINTLMEDYFKFPYRQDDRRGIRVSFFECVIHDDLTGKWVNIPLYKGLHLEQNIQKSLDYLLGCRRDAKPDIDRLEFLTELRQIHSELLVALKYNHCNTFDSRQAQERVEEQLRRLVGKLEDRKLNLPSSEEKIE